MTKLIKFLITCLGTLTLLGSILAAAGLLFAGFWLPSDDVPSVADAIVVLGGGFKRPQHAADLYRRGFAETIYIPRVIRTQSDDVKEEYGFSAPRQEVIYHRILTSEGVPPGAIRFYGQNVRSTVEEAEHMADHLGKGPGRLILVTSPYHVQRARMIFRDALPNWTIIACATPYEEFPEKWWKSQDSARNVVLESTKIIFYLLGGGFRAVEDSAG